MSDISKIKVGGTSHNIKDKPLTDRVSELDEIAASALVDLDERMNLSELTDDEMDEIFGGGGGSSEPAENIYTDEFRDDFTFSDWANEVGESEADIIAAFPDEGYQWGSQKLVNTGETFEYNGENYLMYQVYKGENGSTGWSETSYYALLPANIGLDTLVANSIAEDTSNMYKPFIASVNDDDIYNSDEDGLVKYTVIYAE